jgi:hypothetical protein
MKQINTKWEKTALPIEDVKWVPKGCTVWSRMEDGKLVYRVERHGQEPTDKDESNLTVDEAALEAMKKTGFPW